MRTWKLPPTLTGTGTLSRGKLYPKAIMQHWVQCNILHGVHCTIFDTCPPRLQKDVLFSTQVSHFARMCGAVCFNIYTTNIIGRCGTQSFPLTVFMHYLCEQSFCTKSECCEMIKWYSNNSKIVFRSSKH